MIADERLGAGLALEGPLSRRHLVEDRAERELVRAEVHASPLACSGRHVADGPEDRARLVAGAPSSAAPRAPPRRSRLDELGQAEVQDLDEPVLGDHHVLGLQVPVHDARLVRLGQAVGDLRRRVEELPRRAARRRASSSRSVLPSTSSIAM